MGDIIPFGMRSAKNPNKVMGMDELFADLATVHINKNDYWTHKCPRMGEYTMSNDRNECRYCGTKKGK